MKEVAPILQVIIGLIISIILIPIGLVYNLGKSIYESFSRSIIYGITKFFLYWTYVFIQLWYVLKYLFHHFGMALDYLGNVTTGEMIEDCVTTEEKTLYGRGEITISAATGEIESKHKLNKTGKIFSKSLDKAFFENNHCLNAWDRNKYKI